MSDAEIAQQINETRQFFERMGRNFPWVITTEDALPETLKRPEILKTLIASGILTQITSNGRECYILGSNGAMLSSAWKTEALTVQMAKFTIIVVVLTVIQAMFLLLQVSKEFHWFGL